MPHTASHRGSPLLPSRCASCWWVTSRGVVGDDARRKREAKEAHREDACGDKPRDTDRPKTRPVSSVRRTRGLCVRQ